MQHLPVPAPSQVCSTRQKDTTVRITTSDTLSTPSATATRVKRLRVSLVIGGSLLASACADPAVRPRDLDVWIGMPVEALDSQPLFSGIAMVRTVADDGVEIRNYASRRDFASCAGSASAIATGSYVSPDAFSNCTGGWAGCSNLFYIRNGKILEYAPTGRCSTNESVWPKARFMRSNAASGVA